MNDQNESFGSTSHASSTPTDVKSEAERAGARVGAQLGRVAETAGSKLDSAADYLSQSAESVKQSVQSITDGGWEGLKTRAINYTRKEPLSALMLAAGAGILIGWATRQGR